MDPACGSRDSHWVLPPVLRQYCVWQTLYRPGSGSVIPLYRVFAVGILWHVFVCPHHIPQLAAERSADFDGWVVIAVGARSVGRSEHNEAFQRGQTYLAKLLLGQREYKPV